MATVSDLRKFALRLPRVCEKPHCGAPSFRVNNKKCELRWLSNSPVILKPRRAHQTALFDERPATFQPRQVGGVTGSVVILGSHKKSELLALTAEAWSTVVSKTVAGADAAGELRRTPPSEASPLR